MPRAGQHGREPFSCRPPSGLEAPISTAFGLIAILALVLLNGFLVATELALVSVRRTRIQQRLSDGNSRATRVLDRIGHLDTAIASTQLGITMTTLALGWISEPALARVLHPLIARLPFAIGSAGTHVIAFGVAFATVTTLHVVLGRLVPRHLALRNPEATALRVGEPVHEALGALRPIVVAFDWLAGRVVRRLGVEPVRGHELAQSAEDLMVALDASHEAGLVTETAHTLLDRAFSFADLQAREVMVPRTELTALPVDASLDDVVRLTVDTAYTRLPVYEGDTDNIIGIVKVKRMLPRFLQWAEQRQPQLVAVNGASDARPTPAPATADFDLRDAMVAPTLVPETLPLAEVLTRMQETHVQMAVVIDEYGGTAGIVTLQDIVNRLVGRLTEEEDEQPRPTGFAADGTIRLDGLTPLAELRDDYGIDLTGDGVDVDTIGGYVFFRLGRATRVGDEVTTTGGERIVVEAIDGLRVARVRLMGRAAAIPEMPRLDDPVPISA